MTDPTFDKDGYPTEETLKAVEEMPDVAEVLDLVRSAWHWPDWVRDGLTPAEEGVLRVTTGDSARRFIRFSTGGWSGNENLIHALRRNRLVWLEAWRLSGNGGLHIFEYPRRRDE